MARPKSKRSSTAGDKPLKPRRSHRKSRNGCGACKQRHMKCDESRPICLNCKISNRGSQCIYINIGQLPSPPQITSSVDTPSPLHLSSHLSPADPTSISLRPVEFISSALTALKDIPARGDLFDLSHFALYHHLLTNRHVITSIDPSNESVISHTLDHALKAPYLMNQLLALSALHLSKPPWLQQPYYQLATSLQTRALALFNEERQEVSEESCVPMFLFSSLIGVHVLCDTLQGPRESFGAVLDSFITYLSIHRGVRAVTRHSWHTIKNSGLGFILQQIEDAFPAPENKIEATAILHEMIDANASLSSATKYHKAVSTLQRSFSLHAALNHPNKRRFDAAIAFCLDVDDEYFELLKKRQPEALVILAFFAVRSLKNENTDSFEEGEILQTLLHDDADPSKLYYNGRDAGR
ncbi:Upc2 [Fusarium pseudocircinatum]|uniref:Upc2 n=1 Tax=Fusarium pseudocircinatum TaxID=56676 RepID=A0A8H5PLW2_9HYPO|nr:Upc2 [Fusarium pseudocircinatum]